jgi:hypothetical protein
MQILVKKNSVCVSEESGDRNAQRRDDAEQRWRARVAAERAGVGAGELGARVEHARCQRSGVHIANRCRRLVVQHAPWDDVSDTARARAHTYQLHTELAWQSRHFNVLQYAS